MTLGPATVTTLYTAELSGSLGVVAVAEVAQSEAAWVRQSSRLEGLRALPDGWAGEDTRAPEDGTINGASFVLNQLYRNGCPPPSRISSTPTGSVIIEWQIAGGYHEMEVEVGRVEYMFKPATGPAVHSEFSLEGVEAGPEYSTRHVGLRISAENKSISPYHVGR